MREFIQHFIQRGTCRVMATPTQLCSLCSFRTGCVPELVSHIRLVHYSDSNFSLTCGIDGCKKHFKKCSSFLSHVYRHHRQYIVHGVPRKQEDEPQPECLALGEPKLDSLTLPAANAMDIQEENGSLLDHTVHQLLGTDQNEQKKKSALFILELKEVRGLSEVAIKWVISGCNEMLCYNNKRLQAALFEQLSKHGINSQDPHLHQVFQKVSNPFEGLENVYLQDKFLREELGCIVSYYSI